MQFRERRRVIQVIRTTYDPELKRGRSEVVGKIDKSTPAITDKLQRTCTPEEVAEIGAYLANRQTTLRTEAVRAGAETLPAQMRAAAEYFRTHRDGDAKVFAAEIRQAWDELKASLRKAGFSKSKVLKQRAEKGTEAAEAGPQADAPVPEVLAAEVPAIEVAVGVVPVEVKPAAEPGPAKGETKPAKRKPAAPVP